MNDLLTLLLKIPEFLFHLILLLQQMSVQGTHDYTVHLQLLPTKLNSINTTRLFFYSLDHFSILQYSHFA